jgi:hypothetical protein
MGRYGRVRYLGWEHPLYDPYRPSAFPDEQEDSYGEETPRRPAIRTLYAEWAEDAVLAVVPDDWWLGAVTEGAREASCVAVPKPLSKENRNDPHRDFHGA